MGDYIEKRTRLRFPEKIGSYRRSAVIKNAEASAGMSVIYTLCGWFGLPKSFGALRQTIAVNVYNKGVNQMGVTGVPHQGR